MTCAALARMMRSGRRHHICYGDVDCWCEHYAHDKTNYPTDTATHDIFCVEARSLVALASLREAKDPEETPRGGEPIHQAETLRVDAWWQARWREQSEDLAQAHAAIREAATMLKRMHDDETYLPTPGIDRWLALPVVVTGRGVGAEGDASMSDSMKKQYEPHTTEERLGYLVEECGEVLAAAGKTIRWGTESFNPELPVKERETNATWLLRELTDLERAIRYVREDLAP